MGVPSSEWSLRAFTCNFIITSISAGFVSAILDRMVSLALVSVAESTMRRRLRKIQPLVDEL